MKNYVPKILQKRVPRANFNLSTSKTFPLAVGPLYPALWRRVYPRDSFEITPSIEVRSNPLQTDLMGTFRVHIETFFESLHNLYGAFDNNHRVQSDMQLHTFRLPGQGLTLGDITGRPWVFGSVGSCSLMNMLFFPYDTDLTAVPFTRPVSGVNTAFRFNMDTIFTYMDIVRTYYQNEISGGIPFVSRYWSENSLNFVESDNLDQFFLKLRSQVIGIQLESFNYSTLFQGTGLTAWARAIFNNEYQILTNTSLSQVPMSGLALRPYARDIFSTIMAGTSYQSITAPITNSAMSVVSLKSAIKREQMQAAHDFSAGRFADFVQDLFGTNRKPFTDRPELVDVQSFYIDVNTIKTTSATDTQPAASSIGSILQGYNGKTFYFRSDSMHGILMSIVSISPVFSYSEGVQLGVFKEKFTDLFNPKLDGIPPMPLSATHFNFQSQDAGVPSTVTGALGYAPAFIEDMTAVNETYGDFSKNGSLASWATVRATKIIVNDEPLLNFYHYVQPQQWNFMFADQDEYAQNFYCTVHYEISAKRAKSKLIFDEL